MGIEQWKTPRFGAIVNGEFVPIPSDSKPGDLPPAVETGGRWIGGSADYEFAQAVEKSLGSTSPKVAGLSDDSAGYKRMFEDAVRDLAAIDQALGIDPDEAGGSGPILEAIADLKGNAAQRQAGPGANVEMAVPAGFVLMPVDPTHAMWAAMPRMDWGLFTKCYGDMLAAVKATIVEPKPHTSQESAG
ncbi:hypothetical protein [Ralstonia pseudosolanacearum]|uniref:hypothetical protein n=1 Tax=Ralstonia pseudosolanacearum TaxID=1310165 RepID=UPI003CF4457E